MLHPMDTILITRLIHWLFTSYSPHLIQSSPHTVLTSYSPHLIQSSPNTLPASYTLNLMYTPHLTCPTSYTPHCSPHTLFTPYQSSSPHTRTLHLIHSSPNTLPTSYTPRLIHSQFHSLPTSHALPHTLLTSPICFPRLQKMDGIRGIASRKRNPIKSNGICGIENFLDFFNASTHRPKIYYSLFHPYLTLGSTCGVNVWSVNAQSQCSVIQMFYEIFCS